MTIFPITGEQLSLPSFQTAELAPPTPWDEPLTQEDMERRQSEILRTQHEASLLWQAHSLELQQAAAARMVAGQVEAPSVQASVA